MNDGFKLTRAPYWGWMVLLALFNVMLEGAGDAPIIAWTWIAVLAGWVVITYGRVKDIGWHGAWALGAFIPVFNIVIGCLKSKPKRLTGATYREEKEHAAQ